MNRIRQFLKSEDGPTATEYAVMLALIIVACIGAITLLGDALSTTFGTLEGKLNDVNSGM
jgi:pilus assembly protein Flp/PilA